MLRVGVGRMLAAAWWQRTIWNTVMEHFPVHLLPHLPMLSSLHHAGFVEDDDANPGELESE